MDGKVQNAIREPRVSVFVISKQSIVELTDRQSLTAVCIDQNHIGRNQTFVTYLSTINKCTKTPQS